MNTDEGTKTYKFCSICNSEIFDISLSDHMQQIHNFATQGSCTSEKISVKTEIYETNNIDDDGDLEESGASTRKRKPRKSNPTKLNYDTSDTITDLKATLGSKRKNTPIPGSSKKCKNIMKVQLPVKPKQKNKKGEKRITRKDNHENKHKVVASEFDGHDVVIIYADGSREKLADFGLSPDQTTDKSEAVREQILAKRKQIKTTTRAERSERAFINWLEVNVACKNSASVSTSDAESCKSETKRDRRKQIKPRRRDNHVNVAAAPSNDVGSSCDVTQTNGSNNLDTGSDEKDESGRVSPEYIYEELGGNNNKVSPGTTVVNEDSQIIEDDNERTSEATTRNSKPAPVDEKYICGNCGQEFASQGVFNYHIHQFHMGLARRAGLSQEFDEEETKLALKKSFKILNYVRCLKCNKKLGSLTALNYHQNICGVKYEDRLISCKVCKAVMVPGSLNYHMRKYHEPSPEVEEEILSKRKSATLAIKKLQEFSSEEQQSEDLDVDYLQTDEEENVEEYCVIDKPYLTKMGPISLPAKIPNSLQRAWAKQYQETGCAKCRNPMCPMVFDTISELSEHYWLCECIPKVKTLVCKQCPFASHYEVEMVEHCRKHEENQEFYNKDDAVEAVPVSAELTEIPEAPNICIRAKKKSRRDPAPLDVFIDAPMWASLRKIANTCSVPIFPDIKVRPSGWKPVPLEEVSQYLPKVETSLPFFETFRDGPTISYDDQWSTLNRLKGKIDKMKPMFFCGGPVWASSWCPKKDSDRESSDFMTISTFLTMDEEYKTGELPTRPGLIQLWRFTGLAGKVDIGAPEVAYCLAHNFGCVWSMEWCPSGTYHRMQDGNSEDARLGLLAVGFSDGNIRIFSMPWPEQLNVTKKSFIFKKDGDIILKVHNCEEELAQGQIMKLAWFTGENHRYIAAGMSRGAVSVWDLLAESKILKIIHDHSFTILPFISFPAHLSAVTGLSFYGDGPGIFLITCSSDRSQKFWDLRDTFVPASVSKKGLYTDVHWATAWPGAVTCFDDSLGLNHTASVFADCGVYNFLQRPMLVQNAPVWSVAYNEWFNVAIQGDEAGELSCNVLPNMKNNVDCDKSYVKRRVPLSHVEIKYSNCAVEDDNHSMDKVCETLLYEARSDCKLVFIDEDLDDFRKIPPSAFEPFRVSEKMKAGTTSQFPIEAINRVCWNPNEGCSTWVFVGYHSGFGRLLCIQSLDKTLNLDSLSKG